MAAKKIKFFLSAPFPKMAQREGISGVREVPTMR
jgi:hypothetical protein